MIQAIKLWLLSRRKKAPEELHAEASEMLDALRRLCRDADWNQYRRFIDLNVSLQVQALLAAGTTEEVHRLRGYIQGLLHAVQLAESQVQQDDNARERNQRSNAIAASRADAARAALYSSGHWS